MRSSRIFVLLAAFFLAVPVIAAATDFSSTNFTVKDPILSGGGGFATSSSFKLWSSFAQLAIGTSTATNFGVRSGFLYFVDPTSTPTPTPTPSPSPSDGGGNIPLPPRPPILPLPGFVAGLPPIFLTTPEALLPKPGCLRSDFNCDGRINLQDLSIFFAYQPRVVLRNLSVVFSDWTDQLPRLLKDVFSGGAATVQPFVPRITLPPPSGLAQVESVVRPGIGSSAAIPAREGVGYRMLRAVGAFFTAIFRFVGKIFGL